jgi:hypothetical protein
VTVKLLSGAELEFCLFGHLECIFDLDPQISDRAPTLGLAAACHRVRSEAVKLHQ